MEKFLEFLEKSGLRYTKDFYNITIYHNTIAIDIWVNYKIIDIKNMNSYKTIETINIEHTYLDCLKVVLDYIGLEAIKAIKELDNVTKYANWYSYLNHDNIIRKKNPNIEIQFYKSFFHIFLLDSMENVLSHERIVYKDNYKEKVLDFIERNKR